MKTIFIGSYKTIEECYRVIFPKISAFKSQIEMYTLYTLINQLYKFHKD